MFIGFFYALRDEGVPVSLYEWITLMRALSSGLARDSLMDFYYLARSVLVKNEIYFDKYDGAFVKYFSDFGNAAEKTGTSQIAGRVKRALSGADFEDRAEDEDKDEDKEEDRFQAGLDQTSDIPKKGTLEVPVEPPDHDKQLSDSEKKKLKNRRDSSSGNRPGSGGEIRIGGDTGSMTAVKVAGRRMYKDYKDDSIRDLRQFESALKVLRQLSSRFEGPMDELDVNATIEATGSNAGMLTLVWDRPRRNTLKVILLMDSIGSIYRYIDVCKKLFNAAYRSTHFREIKFFYFHNCIYGRIYKSQWLGMNSYIPTNEFFKLYGSDYRVIIVGDAKMAPSELTDIGGIIDWSAEANDETGLTWLNRVARHFQYCVWLNPVPKHMWGREPDFTTISMVEDIFPMFELTPSGLAKAVKKLRVRSRS